MNEEASGECGGSTLFCRISVGGAIIKKHIDMLSTISSMANRIKFLCKIGSFTTIFGKRKEKMYFYM